MDGWRSGDRTKAGPTQTLLKLRLEDQGQMKRVQQLVAGTPLESHSAMFAQSLGEYGALASIGSELRAVSYSIQERLGDVASSTWVIVLCIVLVGLKLWSQRPVR